MAKGKMHFSVPVSGPMPQGLCRVYWGSRVTTNESDVTCVLCRDALKVASKPEPIAPPATCWYKPKRGQREAYPLRDEHAEVVRAWPTWRSAVRAYVMAVDDGWGSKSASDPSRFEALPTGTNETPEGDLAQRQVAQLVFVGRALQNAFVCNWIVTTYPVERLLTAVQCRDILVMRVVGQATAGHPSQVIGGVDRLKQRIVRRSDRDATDIAAEFGVTVGVIEDVVRTGGRRIEQELTASGLVSLADTGLNEREQMSELLPWDLNGWEEIASALGVDVSTARKLRDTKGLPVETMFGKVRAEKAKIKEWLEKQRAA